MRTLGIVPARAGSKRLPRKNVRELGGRSLVAHAIEQGLEAKELDALVVSSDDDDVLRVAEALGVVALKRPAALASDEAPAIGYVEHALAEVEEQLRFEAIVILQPTSPFRSGGDIDACVRHLRATDADSVVTVMEVEHAIHPLKMKTMDGDRLLPFVEEERGRRMAHQLPRVFVRNCAVYASRRAIIDAGDVIGPDCRGIVMPRERSVDINDELDFLFAEFLWERRRC